MINELKITLINDMEINYKKGIKSTLLKQKVLKNSQNIESLKNNYERFDLNHNGFENLNKNQDKGKIYNLNNYSKNIEIKFDRKRASHSIANFFPILNINKPPQNINQENKIKNLNEEVRFQSNHQDKRQISDKLSDKFEFKIVAKNKKRTSSNESSNFKENINLRFQNESIKSLQYFEDHINNEIIEREKKKVFSKHKSEENFLIFPVFQNDILRINLSKTEINKNNFFSEYNDKNILNQENFKYENKNANLTNDKNQKKDNKEDITEILKRVKEKNLKEADARNRTFYNNISNLKFRINNNFNNFIFSSFNKSKKLLKNNTLELFISDKCLWNKHEEIWKLVNIKNKEFVYNYDLEKYIVPPNDNDILLNMYCSLNSIINDLIIISPNNTPYPRQEIMKWKDAYKKSVLRWHPDKLINMLDKVTISEDKKNLLKDKCGIYINNINKSIFSILEHLRLIQKIN